MLRRMAKPGDQGPRDGQLGLALAALVGLVLGPGVAIAVTGHLTEFHWPPTAEEWTAYWTFVLVAFTGGVVVFARRAWLVQVDDRDAQVRAATREQQIRFVHDAVHLVRVAMMTGDVKYAQRVGNNHVILRQFKTLEEHNLRPGAGAAEDGPLTADQLPDPELIARANEALWALPRTALPLHRMVLDLQPDDFVYSVDPDRSLGRRLNEEAEATLKGLVDGEDL